MDQNKVDMYVMTNQKYFPAEKIMYLKEKLAAMDESKFTMVSTPLSLKTRPQFFWSPFS